MPKVIFSYDIKKDAWSWVLIAKSKSHWGRDPKSQIIHIPDNLLKKILENPRPKAEEFVIEHLKNHPKREYREKVIYEEINALCNIWQTKEESYFKILSEITKKPIYAEKFGAYTTSGFMCPYSFGKNSIDWFMFSMWHNLPFSITTICHELMHFQFLYYYKDKLKKSGLSESQIGDLKESLTFLLNAKEFKSIILSEDQGYPDHQELRKYLLKVWNKEKDFDKLINQAVEKILG
jgi:hypothetical protein